MTDSKLIQFVHANAYNPRCYKKFLAHFDEDEVLTPQLRPLWKDSDPAMFKDWNVFADDLIKMMDERSLKDVIGIGHSLGGVTSWLAAQKRPDLFAKLILIDPVILDQVNKRGLRFMPFFMRKRIIPIVKIASKRRNSWPSHEAIREHLGNKKLFKRFDPEVFDDFIEYGFVSSNEGYQLAYPREWEARVYAYPPNLWPLLAQNKVPTTIIRAEYSDVINNVSWQKIKDTMTNASFIQMDKVGHLIPFEKPAEIAQIIKGLID